MLTLNQIAVSYITNLIQSMPMTGYRTYVVNITGVLLWVIMALVTGHWEVAGGFVVQYLSNMFTRASNTNQSAKLIYIESMLQDISQAVLTNEKQLPRGPEADTRVRTN